MLADPVAAQKAARAEGLVRAVAADGALTTPVPPGTLEHLFRDASTLRRASARLVALQRDGKVTVHRSPVGEEGALAGAVAALEAHDWVFPTPREALVALLRGVTPEAYFHHAAGDAADPLEGRVPPDHLSSRAANVAPPEGTLGAHLTHAVGCAWAMRGKSRVALAFLDAAATVTGHFHNALNFAGVFAAPAVLVCRADGRRAVDPSSRGDIAGKSIAYGVPCARVDGADPVAVFAVVSEAVGRARRGEGASFVEVVTSPPTDGTLDVDPARDPLRTLERALERAGSPLDRRRVEDEIDQALARAVAAGLGAGRPPRETIFTNVYEALPGHLRAQAGP